MNQRRLISALALLAVLCLLQFGCGSQNQELDLPSIEEPVVMVMWEKADQPPRVLQAERVRQERNESDGSLQTTCIQVMLRMPLGDGEMVLVAPRAVINDASGEIIFTPPIHLAGTIEGRPLQGRARAATMQTKAMELQMNEVEWVHNGQRLQVAALKLRDNWRSRIAEQPSGRPAPLALTAAQSALPYPLQLPPFQRSPAQE